MANLEDYPTEHPENGKVKNPLTGNWITQDYARREGVLEQAKEHTQQHFKEQDEAEETSEEIDQLLQEAEDVDPGEAFELDEEELDEEIERLDERADIDHPEVPDSDFPEEQDFSAEEEFDQPPTPEGFEQAANPKQNTGEFQGIYSGNSPSNRGRERQGQEQKSLEQKHEDEEVRYVRTEQGGMKMVYPNEENNE